MKKTKWILSVNKLFLFSIFILLIACDRSSSPEGRMTIKLEELQQQMQDSLAQQNRKILDSLSAIRQELNAIKQQK
ncbi:MAG: hypothetical protein H0V30_07640 [Chitinophagaceae bacterium]|nr:hypothetical protein [Chitinophagaceae bacterium]